MILFRNVSIGIQNDLELYQMEYSMLNCIKWNTTNFLFSLYQMEYKFILSCIKWNTINLSCYVVFIPSSLYQDMPHIFSSWSQKYLGKECELRCFHMPKNNNLLNATCDTLEDCRSKDDHSS